MLAYFRRPHSDLAALILRMGLGFLFLGYGYIKVSQDKAVSEVMTFQLQQAVGWLELICGGLLAIGLLTRLAALGVIVDMVGAIVLVTGKREFFGLSVGPHGVTFQPGFEYNIILILICLALMVMGGGWFSLDHMIFGRLGRTASTSVPVGGPLPLPQGVPSASVKTRD